MQYRSIYVFLFCLIILSACKNSNSPQSVAEGFVVHYSQMDYETAKSLSTKNTWDFLEVFEYYSENLDAEQKKKIREQKVRFKVIDQQKESDTSIILTYKAEPQKLPFDKLRLISHVDRNGRTKWKVDISTISIIEGEDIYMLPSEALIDEVLEVEDNEGEAIIDTTNFDE
ncbi:MAG TPA: hypothetical protein VK027_00450 [Chitinophagaceae bacterium]|nr:hypothetical protein [Chitinophagaceae bacterium]